MVFTMLINKLKILTKYNFIVSFKALLAFYGFYLSFMLIMSLIFSIAVDDTTISTGADISCMIFLFVTGLNSFKSTLHFSLANSVSRKTGFVAELVGFLPIAGIMAVVDYAFFYLSSFLSFGNISIYTLTYGSANLNELQSIPFSFQNMIQNILWSFLMYFVVIMVGYLISGLYYRMGKMLKYYVSFGVPIIFIILIPTLDAVYLGGTLMKNVIYFIMTILGISNGIPNPWVAMLSFTIISLGLVALSYITIRRATVKE